MFLLGSTLFFQTQDHNHAAQPEMIQRRETMNQLKKEVENNPTATTRDDINLYLAINTRITGLLWKCNAASTGRVV